jgi:5-methylcytosine-specific restriction endonuclease McrA
VVKAFRDKFIVDNRQITLSVLEKQKLISLQSNICPICKGPLFIQDEIEIDHINPLAVGGKDRFLNLQATHKICNRKKGVKVL